ncbi:hypothetical protein DFJ74DRAFT_760603 [Hyaloraphidium curvatum]|nr:hypothetical protein DFJ74DRAFT_760603 [Hyaloraphidium curvatum]
MAAASSTPPHDALIPAHRMSSFQSIVDNLAASDEASGTFRSASWYSDFSTPLGWQPAPGVTTSYELWQRGEGLPGPNGENGPDKPCLGVRTPHRTGPYSTWLSFGQVRDLAIACGSAMKLACGLEGQVPGVPWDGRNETVEVATGDKIAIYAPNCVEWRVADLAAMFYNIVSVPVFPNADAEGVAHMFSLCKIRLCFCLKDQLAKVEALKSPHLRFLVVVPARDGSGRLTGGERDAFMSRNHAVQKVWNWDEFVALGQVTPLPVTPATHPDEIVTICFTSGSTGLPKGAMISHKNMLAESAVWIEMCPTGPEQMSTSDLFMSYSPLAHQAERCIYWALTCRGVPIGLWSGDPAHLFDDVRALKPTICYLVPRIGNRLVQTLKAMFLTTPERRAAFEASYAAKRRVLLTTGKPPRDPALDDSLGIMAGMRAYMGGRFRFSASGAAPAPAANLEFHRVVFGIHLFERFGQTETTSAFTATKFGDVWTPYGSHVGTATRQSEFRLLSRPEMGYSVVRGDGRWIGSKGEVACRGHVVFRGYYLQPEKTREALDADGWLLTGDICEIMPDGTLKVIDRAKNVFKLSRGEFVVPEKVEVTYIRSRYVMQIYVDGHRDQPSLVAVVVPDPEQIAAFAKSIGIPASTSQEQLAKDPRVVKEVFDDMLKIGTEAGLQFFEQVAAITLHTDPFTVENNLLTPTIKNRRPMLKQRFAADFAKMYAEVEATEAQRAKDKARGASKL